MSRVVARLHRPAGDDLSVRSEGVELSVVDDPVRGPEGAARADDDPSFLADMRSFRNRGARFGYHCAQDRLNWDDYLRRMGGLGQRVGRMLVR